MIHPCSRERSMSAVSPAKPISTIVREDIPQEHAPIELFVARQPIFDGQGEVFGYELLFRNGPENFFPKVDGSRASTRIIHDGLHVFGLDTVSGGKRIFINLTRDVLVQ